MERYFNLEYNCSSPGEFTVAVGWFFFCAKENTAVQHATASNANFLMCLV
jgi:hypothetical protein